MLRARTHFHFSPDVSAGRPAGLSRRQFLCTTAAATVAVPMATALATSPAAAQSQPTAQAPGRPILIKNGCVLSLDRSVGDFEQADVLIRGSKIAEVRPNIAAADAEVIDASRAIVMPGFVDTHRHMWQGILRNIIPDASLQEYFRVVQRTLGPAYTPDDLYAANLVSALAPLTPALPTFSTGRTFRTPPSTPTPRSRA